MSIKRRKYGVVHGLAEWLEHRQRRMARMAAGVSEKGGARGT